MRLLTLGTSFSNVFPDEGHFCTGNSEAFGDVVATRQELLGDGRWLPDEAADFLFVGLVFAFYLS